MIYAQPDYSPTHKEKTLAEGTYKGYHYLVLDAYFAPTAYVEIPKNHPDYNNSDYGDFQLSYHPDWGYTYFDTGPYILDDLPKYAPKNAKWLGWDHAHCDDAVTVNGATREGKHYTTEQVIGECKQVIDALLEK